MTARAYVLIEAQAGQLPETVAALRAIPGVRVADVVTGPYDIIITIETSDQRGIGRLVMDALHGIPAIKRTITCMAIE